MAQATVFDKLLVDSEIYQHEIDYDDQFKMPIYVIKQILAEKDYELLNEILTYHSDVRMEHEKCDAFRCDHITEGKHLSQYVCEDELYCCKNVRHYTFKYLKNRHLNNNYNMLTHTLSKKHAFYRFKTEIDESLHEIAQHLDHSDLKKVRYQQLYMHYR